jgi:hypothetical protein
MIKHEHPEFPADMIVLLEAVNAKLEIRKLKHRYFQFIFKLKLIRRFCLK